MAAAGVCAKHIACALGVGDRTVRRWARRHGWRLTDGRGKHNPRGHYVMTPDRDARARDMAAKGLTTRQTAETLGIRHKTVCRWAERNGVRFGRCTWVHVARRLPEAIRDDYRVLRRHGYSVADALRALSRPDLIGARR